MALALRRRIDIQSQCPRRQTNADLVPSDGARLEVHVGFCRSFAVLTTCYVTSCTPLLFSRVARQVAAAMVTSRQSLGVGSGTESNIVTFSNQSSAETVSLQARMTVILPEGRRLIRVGQYSFDEPRRNRDSYRCIRE
jgi:hypothetical protein